MRIAFVTIHFKNLDDTLELLRSLSDTEIPKGSEIGIYVVDNEGSHPLRVQLAAKFKQVILIESGGNFGFSGGNNLGLKQALADNFDVLVSINNDTFVDKNFIKRIVESPISEKTTGAVGGLIYFAPGFEYKKNYRHQDLGKVIWYAGGKFDWENVLGSNGHVDEVDHGQFKNIEPTDFVTGALLITRADVLRQVGLFDDNYFMYLEDVDLCMRIKNVGYRILFDPNIKIWHKVAQASGIGSPLNDYFITRNRLYFGFKYTSLRTRFALTREAVKKMFIGTSAQKRAIIDFFSRKLGKGSYL